MRACLDYSLDRMVMLTPMEGHATWRTWLMAASRKVTDDATAEAVAAAVAASVGDACKMMGTM